MRVGDDSGLTVLGGSGHSGSVDGSGIVGYANNPGWFDDTSDGPVTAAVVLKDGTVVQADPAWVVVAPPDFAPPIENIVTMHDAMYDIAVRMLGFDTNLFNAGQFVAGFIPSFEEHIFPILHRAFRYRWVYDEHPPGASTFHTTLANIVQLGTPPTSAGDPFQTRRVAIFNRLRDPAVADSTPVRDGKIPKLFGDTDEDSSALTLTATQYALDGPLARRQLYARERALAPTAADRRDGVGARPRGAEACVGGAFFPGIECGWIIREPGLYAQPFGFRFRHAASASDPTGVWPGDVTKRSALAVAGGLLRLRE